MSIAGNISFLFNGYELADAVHQMSFKLNMDELDASVLATNFRKYESGYAGATLDTSGFFDADTVNDDEINDVFSAAFTGQGTNHLISSLGTVSVGAFAFVLDACQTSYAVNNQIGQLITADANFRSKTGLDFGKWLLNAVVVAGTTTGSVVDNGAASTNGGLFVVQLHNDTASDVDTKVQHSTTGVGSWVDLTSVNDLSATHASGSATVAHGTTVNRYLRVLSTATGGDTIKVSAAFARR